MELGLPEAIVRFVVSDPLGGGERVLEKQSCKEYLLDDVETAIYGVADAVGPVSDPAAAAGESRVEVRVWSREGVRASLHLCAETVLRIAATSAAFDFDLQPMASVEEPEEPFEKDEVNDNPAPKPELTVVFIGDPPDTGIEQVIATASRALYSVDGLEACIKEVIEAAHHTIQGDVASWKPEIGVRLLSFRGIPPSLYLPSKVVQAIASCGASVDFDPYV